SLPKAPDGSLNYPGYGYSNSKDKMITARVEYDVSDNLTVYGGIGRRKDQLDAVAGNPNLDNSAGDFSSYAAWQVRDIQSTTYDLGANMRFETGPVKHKVSANYSRVKSSDDIYFT